MGKGEPLQVQLPALRSINPDSSGLFSAFFWVSNSAASPVPIVGSAGRPLTYPSSLRMVYGRPGFLSCQVDKGVL